MTDTNTVNTKKPIPPYLPYKTFVNTLAAWRVALPGRIDRSLLGSYSGAIQSWMLGTLRYFELTDMTGHPTDRLRALVAAEGEVRQKHLAELVRLGYPFLFTEGLDVSKITTAQLDEKFTESGAHGDTVRRCVGFFMGLAKDAGIPLSPYLKMRRATGNGRKGSALTPKQSKQRRVAAAEAHQPDAPAPQLPAFQMLYQLLDPERMDEQEEQAVWTLLRHLKKKREPS